MVVWEWMVTEAMGLPILSELQMSYEYIMLRCKLILSSEFLLFVQMIAILLIISGLDGSDCFARSRSPGLATSRKKPLEHLIFTF